jgi:hypothetical protein
MGIPEIKRCTNCGAFCGPEIDICPGHKNGSLDLCRSSDFRPITPEERKGIMEGRIWVHFKEWPILPSEKAWKGRDKKDALEKPHPN